MSEQSKPRELAKKHWQEMMAPYPGVHTNLFPCLYEAFSEYRGNDHQGYCEELMKQAFDALSARCAELEKELAVERDKEKQTFLQAKLEVGSRVFDEIESLRAQLIEATQREINLRADWLEAREQLAEKDAEVERLNKFLAPDNLREVILEWKHCWMNQRQNSEADFQNYYHRAFGVDANMQYSLADMLKNASLKHKGD